MANKRGKSVDSTYLDVDQIHSRGILHRDYLAHTLRWSHVLRRLKPGSPERVLDVACGKLAPLAKVLYTNRQTMHRYLGVDVGPIEPDIKFSEKFSPKFLEYVDFSTMSFDDVAALLEGDATLVTCFEAAEHMEPDHCVKFLRNIFDVAYPKADILISTPCYDPRVGPADNHVSEWTYQAFGSLLELIGFGVRNHWGTFASQRDYVDEMGEAEHLIFDRLHQYYDSNVLSCLMAPLFPAHSRNVIWHLDTSGVTQCAPQWRISLFNAFKSGQVLGSSTNADAWKRFGQAFGWD